MNSGASNAPLSWGGGGRMACNENRLGRLRSNSPTTRSKRRCDVPSFATRLTSASEKVSVPSPSSARAATAISMARAHSVDGTPRPTSQLSPVARPAASAAVIIRAAFASVSAEQTSRVATSPSRIIRKAKGVITGRGAEMSITTSNPA